MAALASTRQRPGLSFPIKPSHGLGPVAWLGEGAKGFLGGLPQSPGARDPSVAQRGAQQGEAKPGRRRPRPPRPPSVTLLHNREP